MPTKKLDPKNKAKLVRLSALLKDLNDDSRAIDELLADVKARVDSAQTRTINKPEAPPDAPLGQIAFAEDRLDNVPFELNTPVETELFDRLSFHVDDIIQEPMPDASVELIRSFIRDKIYKSVFRPPSVKVVYRGMAVSEERLLKIMKKPREGLTIPSKGSHSATWTMRPRTGASSSWTKDRSVARDFGYRSVPPPDVPRGGDAPYVIIVHALVAQNPGSFIDMSQIYKKLRGFEIYAEEAEVIGLGEIVAAQVDWEKVR